MLSAARIAVTIAAFGLAAAHVFVPRAKLDWIALTLLGVGLLPWVGVLLRSLHLPEGISSLELPGGVKITGTDIGTQKQRREEDTRGLSSPMGEPHDGHEVPVDSRTYPAAASAHLLAEELALRKVEAERHVNVHRQRRLRIVGRSILVDGLFDERGIPVIVEVELVRSLRVSDRLFERLFADITELKMQSNRLKRISEVRLLIIVVSDLPKDDMNLLEHRLLKSMQLAPCPTELEVVDFDALRHDFGLEDEGT